MIDKVYIVIDRNYGDIDAIFHTYEGAEDHKAFLIEERMDMDEADENEYIYYEEELDIETHKVEGITRVAV